MWKSVADLLSKAQETLGIEVVGLPDLGGVTESVTGAVEVVGGNAAEVVTDVGQTLTDTANQTTDAGT